MAFEVLGKVDSAAINPVAIGLISDPPTIVLTYDLISLASTNKKRQRRKRKMPLRDFTDKSNVKRYAFNLRQRHNKYLTDVTDVTLEKMLRIIQEIQKGNSVGKSLELVNKEYSIDPKEDLNTLSPAQLAQRKAVMEETFRKNLVKPGDPDYVYDKVIQFEEEGCEAVNNDWDEEEGMGDQADKRDAQDGNDHNDTKEVLDENEKDLNLTEDAVAENQSELPGDISLEKENKKVSTLLETKAQDSFEQDDDEEEEGIMQVQRTEPETDESSSNDNIEEALEIETGGLEEEDEEDFWQ